MQLIRLNKIIQFENAHNILLYNIEILYKSLCINTDNVNFKLEYKSIHSNTL